MAAQLSGKLGGPQASWEEYTCGGSGFARSRSRRAHPARRPQTPYPTYPAPRFPTTIPARRKTGRWCHQSRASVVRAAQPATQADAAAQPEGCGHFAARSRHERDTGVSLRRSLVALRWARHRTLVSLSMPEKAGTIQSHARVSVM